jgi:hypothetical protein
VKNRLRSVVDNGKAVGATVFTDIDVEGATLALGVGLGLMVLLTLTAQPAIKTVESAIAATTTIMAFFIQTF